METAKEKRERIEGAVESHPRLCKVADYLAEKHNLEKDAVREKFINFLEKENFTYFDKLPHNVLCFEFNVDKGEFVNRTLTTYDNPY